MPKIKLRESVKNIKVLDKSKELSTHMKNAFIRSKESAEQTVEHTHNSPAEYATEKVADKSSNLAHKTAYHSTKQAKNAVNSGRNLFRKRRQANDIKRSANTVNNSFSKPISSANTYTGNVYKSVRQSKSAVKSTAKTASKTVKQTEKGTIKTIKKSVKTVEKGGKVAIKTAKSSAKAAQKSAQAAARAAKLSMQAARAATKATIAATKLAIKVTIASVKAIIAATKALISAIVAGGWVAVVIILLICIIGMILASPMAIFAGNETGAGIDSSQTVQTAISTVNTEFYKRVDDMKNSQTDISQTVLEINGVQSSDLTPIWKEVLALYSVKTTTSDSSGTLAINFDASKTQDLKNVFFDVVSLSSEVKSDTEDVPTSSDNSTTSNVTINTLYVNASTKSLADMEAEYGFTPKQISAVNELTSPQYDSEWTMLLNGSTNGSGSGVVNGTMVNVAISQIGNVNGEPYWRWYGFNSRVPWCAIFVSWCANQCGYLDDGTIPKFSWVQDGIDWFKTKNEWIDGSATPVTGDIIFFDWDGSGPEHVGIVEYVANGVVHTVEGNTSATRS